jgi:sulfane dehydrogenase subunit SoxC
MMGTDGGYGSRSQFETEVRVWQPARTASYTPMQKGQGIVTPSGLHYERHHGGIPNIDPRKHALVIHGLVERPMKFSVADLMRFPSVSRIYFIECSGTSGGELMKATMPTAQRTHGLVSTSEWTGVQLSTLFKQVGLKDDAAWVLAEGADAAVMTRSVPLDKCLTDALIVYAQNGEAIRPEQGYPIRLFLPGWEGNISVKWLRRLEVGDKPYQTREETSKYTDIITRTGKARQFTFTMEAKSVITFPSAEMKLPGPGFYEVTGLAWSGRGRIARVEVTTDGGKTWHLASLQDPILPIAQTRFRYPWVWDGSAAIVASRATDETGYTQPAKEQLIAERGPLEGGGLFYHMNAVQHWSIDRDGNVKNWHPLQKGIGS